jgi:hypothetical protein
MLHHLDNTQRVCVRYFGPKNLRNSFYNDGRSGAELVQVCCVLEERRGVGRRN